MNRLVGDLFELSLIQSGTLKLRPENIELLDVVSVPDQGSGVASEDLSHMFGIGWRATEARTPEQHTGGSPGAGLGLAIVRGIVEAHGGGVNAENGLEGFRLSVALPTTVS
jgi:signal transduction histidine kinase